MLCFSKPAYFAFVLAFFGFLGCQSKSHAATLSFDYTSGVPNAVATVTGTSGTMNFQLDLNDPTLSNVFGNFSMDIYGPGSILLGTISLDGGPLIDGIASQDFSNIATPGVNDVLPNVSTWSLTVSGANLPLSLIVTSELDSIGDPVNPVLTVDFTDDLRVADTTTPLPSALPLFASGLGITLFLSMRRKRRCDTA
jgi:hypothetical protein